MTQWSGICFPMQERWLDPWVRKIPLEKEMATHSSILAWAIPWTGMPGQLWSMRSQRVRRDLETKTTYFILHFLEMNFFHFQWECGLSLEIYYESERNLATTERRKQDWHMTVLYWFSLLSFLCQKPGQQKRFTSRLCVCLEKLKFNINGSQNCTRTHSWVFKGSAV